MAEIGLEDHLRALIGAEGPQPLSVLMALALAHPRGGYYAAGAPIGRKGDFITAPEISQLFGEMIGVFAAETFERLGAPSRWRIAEFGPGRGTLMADVLRVLRLRPEALSALEVDLIDLSEPLRREQKMRLAGAVPIAWRRDLGEIPNGPSLFLMNEFLDALPVRQFVKTLAGWAERKVGLTPMGELALVVTPAPLEAARLGAPDDMPAGSAYEASEAARALILDLARRLASTPGRALIIDYGAASPTGQPTIQAVRRHQPAGLLEQIGQTDISAHVDFAAIAAAARSGGAEVFGPIGQGAFLRALGIEVRAHRLKQRNPQHSDEIDAAAGRLTGADAMGELFQVMVISSKGLAPPPGFTQEA